MMRIQFNILWLYHKIFFSSRLSDHAVMSEMSTKKTLPPGKFQLRNEHFTFKPVTKTLTKGLAKLGSLVSETLVQTKIFHSLASREKILQKQILGLGSKRMFLNQVKKIFASQTQILFPKRMFPNLATQGHMKETCLGTMFLQQSFLV